MTRFPAFLDLEGRSCLLVGGGVVAYRKLRLLLRAGARVTVVAQEVSKELRALAPERVRLVERRFEAADVAGHRLVVAASDDADVNRRAAAAAADAGLWCNVVDDPRLSTFYVPAIVDRSPVVVAIGTGGAAPVLAQQLKTRIETLLPARLGRLAERAGRWRSLVARRFGTQEARRRIWQALFDGPIAEDLVAGRERRAERRFREAVVAPAGPEERPAGVAWLVGAGPGDPELLTLRGLRLLARADTILYDALVAPAVLDYARKDATLVPVGKRSGEKDSQAAINRELLRRVRAGEKVCRLKGGDPGIFGRVGEEACALAAAGLDYEIVPGISAALGCAAAAGFPLTHRGLAASVTFATAQVGPSAELDWASLARPGQTLALYMAVQTLERVTDGLLAGGLPPDTPAVIVENGTRDEQRIVDGKLADIAGLARAAGVGSPAMLFAGEVVGLNRRPAAREVARSRPIPFSSSQVIATQRSFT